MPLLAISAGLYHNCAIKDADRSIVCWGQSNGDRLVAPTGAFVSLAAGSAHTCAVREGGTVVCWGSNGSGELTVP